MENENMQKSSAIASFMILSKLFAVQTNINEIIDFYKNSGIENEEVLLLRLANKAGLKSRLCKMKEEKFIKNTEKILPVIVKGKNGEFFIAAKVNGDNIMLMFPNKTTPDIMPLSEFYDIWDGTVIIIAKKGETINNIKFGFKWFIPTILKFKNEFIHVLLAVFIVQILGILTPIMTQVVVDKVLSHKSLSTLYVITIGIVVVYIVDLILTLAKNYIFTHTTNRIDVLLSSKLFKHLFALPLKYFELRRTGETVARVRELDSIRSFLTGTPLSSVIDLIFIIVYIVVLLFYNVKLTLIVISSIPIYALLSYIVTPLFKKHLEQKFNAGAETSSFLVEAINGVQTVKSFALENKFESKWGNLQAEYVKASYKTSMVSSTASTVAGFIQKVFDLLILFFGTLAVIDGDFSIGQLVAFRMLAGRVSGPVLRFVQLWQEYQQAALSVERIGDIFNTPEEVRPSSSVSSLPKLNGKIKFDKVHFRYRMEASEVIKNMSFEIEAGSIIGIMGRSGSGKSTISKLIQRMYIPESGKITIDGIDIALVSPEELRKQVGIVLQESFMFNGTVRENISIHMSGASIEQVMEAAKTAGAHDFILELSNGYDTMIGEKGVGLSGGQKQRIAIARAIIANPRILIFDEATSALDYESESIIQNNLIEICKDRTVIIIAHRLSTLKSAKKIMVIDNGNLEGYDTHKNLIKNNKLYTYLYSQQQKGDIDE